MFRGVVARAFCGKSFGSFGKFSHLVPQLQLSDSIPISSFPVSSNNEKYGERGCSRPLDTRSLTIAKVKAYQKEGENLNDLLFSSLNEASSLLEAPDPRRRPLIFYQAHNSVFACVKTAQAGLHDPIDDNWVDLFERGVWELPGDDTKHANDFEWPNQDEVLNIVQTCRDILDKSIEKVNWDVPVKQNSAAWAILMASEHERIHFETSSVLFRQLPSELVHRPDEWGHDIVRAVARNEAPKNELIYLEGVDEMQLARCKQDPNFNTYGWDNEFGERTVNVPSFAATKYLISNAEFAEFVDDNGYNTERWWRSHTSDLTSDGWAWRCETSAQHPLFWIPEDVCETQQASRFLTATQSISAPSYRLRSMFDIISMPWDWPVEVNSYEAQAFCRWRSWREGVQYKLPTEAQFHVCRGVKSGQSIGNVPIDRANANLDLKLGSLVPVDWFRPGNTGLCDVSGNVWQLTRTAFYPFNGWKPNVFYPEFSSPFFNRDNLISLGGSFSSVGTSSNQNYRVWWLQHFHQHMGFRMVCEQY